MKKALVLVMALLLPLSVMAATSGNGTCTVSPSTAGTGDNFHFNTFTFTYTVKTNNTVAGIAFCEYPSTWGTAVGKVTLAGTATEAKTLKTWTDADTGKKYFGCTMTADVDQTVEFAWSTTVTAVAGAQTFTWYTADAVTTTYTGVAVIASQPAITVSSSNNPITWAAPVVPTPNIITTTKSVIEYHGAFDIAVSGGQMIFNMVVGTPGYQSTPSPMTWVANATVKNNSIQVIAEAGVFSGSPTCNATQCIVPIGTAAANSTVVVRWGNPSQTCTVGPQGETYANGLGIKFRTNAFFPASTVTPQAMPTTYTNSTGVSGLLVTIATPTVVLTPVYTGNKVELKMSGFVNSNKKVLSSGSKYQSVGSRNATASSYAFDAGLYGAYTIYGYLGWYDYDNDGVYRTVTSNAVTLYKFSDLSLDELENRGLLSTDIFSKVKVAAADVVGTTLWATAAVIMQVDAYGQSATSYEVAQVVDGGNVTKTALGHGNNELARETNVYVVPADRRVNVVVDKISGDSASDEKVFIRSYTLPAR